MNEINIPGKSPVTETDFCLHVMYNLTEAYAVQVQELESMMLQDPTSVTVTVKVMRTKLETQYIRRQANKLSNRSGRKRALQA